ELTDAAGVASCSRRGHWDTPVGWALLRASACRWPNRGSRYTRAPKPNRPVVVVVVHPCCAAKASPRACTRSDSRCWRRVIQVMSAGLRFGFGLAVGVAGVDAVAGHVPALGG